MPVQVNAEPQGRVFQSRIGAADLALGTRMLSELLASGLSIGRALQAFDDLAPVSWRRHLPRIVDDVRAGASLSRALSNLDGAVPPMMVGLVRAGEMGSGLPKALETAAMVFEAAAAARTTLVASLTYPAFLLLACGASLLLLVGVVLPRFAGLLADLGQQVPHSTALLLDLSRVVQHWGGISLGTASLVLGLLWWWIGSAPGRARWHALLLRLPIIGEVRHAWASASICAAAGALVEAGVRLPVALQHASLACGDAAVASRVTAARDDVLGGSRPSDALAAHSAITRIAVRLLRSGEETGNVASALLRAAQMERARAVRTLQATLKLLEPALVIGFGALVAFVASALLQAVYAIRPAS